MKQNISMALIIVNLAIASIGCTEDTIQEKLSNEKQIESFVITSLDPTVISAIEDDAIKIMVPFITDVTSLMPDIKISINASIFPASGIVQDFTNPVEYVVTAEDESTHIYIVTVNRLEPLDNAKEIIAFTFDEFDPKIIGNIDAFQIKTWVPDQTDRTHLKPSIEVSDNATILPASGESQDFTNPVTYVVTAEDGTWQEYIVTVTEDKELDVTSGPAFNWINWYLSVPISNGGSATSIYYESIQNNTLSEAEAEYFYKNADNSYTMYSKFTGATTSGNSPIGGSKYCRTELREFWKGKQSTSDNWFMDATSSHALASTLKVDFCNGSGQTYVAQIHGKSTTGAPGDPATVKVFWSAGKLIIENYRKPTIDGDEWTSKYITKTSIGQVDNEKFTIKLLVKRGVLHYALYCENKGINVEYTELYDYAANGYVHHNYFKTGNYFKWNDDLIQDSQVILYSARTAHQE